MKTPWNVTAVGLALAMLLLSQGGCATSSNVAKADPDEALVKLSGKVVETADAGGYTYVLLEKDGKRTWAAIPPTKVKVGDQLDLAPGGELKGFTSKTLGRTFDSIYFSGGTVQDVKAAAQKTAEEQKKAAEVKKTGKPQPFKPVLAGKVVETMDAGNYTYICLEKDGKKGWSAVPSSEVKVGDEIELMPGVDMGEFTSSKLQRTFDNIHFSGGIKGADGKVKASRLDKPAPPADAQHAHAKQQPAAAPKADAPAPAPIEGKVVETMNSGGYSYVCVEKAGKKTWLAVPAMKVSVGSTMAFQPGMTMSNFTSKSLNRTFDQIIFSGGPAEK